MRMISSLGGGGGSRKQFRGVGRGASPPCRPAAAVPPGRHGRPPPCRHLSPVTTASPPTSPHRTPYTFRARPACTGSFFFGDVLVGHPGATPQLGWGV
eukprot:scaffold2872_cov112-Isochrysis_galbana.AAC.14